MEQDKGQDPPSPLWILWGMMTGSVFFYGAVGYFLRKSGVIAPSVELLSLLMPAFLLLAAVEAMALFLVFQKFVVRKVTYSSYSILRWTLAESIGIYGLILFVLGGSRLIFGGFLGGSLLLNLVMMPSAEDRDRFDSLKANS